MKTIAVSIGAALACTAAEASVIDDFGFEVQGLIVVWGADAANSAPIVSDFIIDSGSGTTAATSGDADLIAGDAYTVVTGTLVSTSNSLNAAGGIPFVIENTTSGDINSDTNNNGRIDSEDAFSPFGIQIASDARVDATSMSTSFYVASNTPFAIDAQAIPPTTFTQFILLQVTRLNLSVTLTGDDGMPFGASAQYPHSGGPTGGVVGANRLFDLLTPRRVFSGDQRTAASPGGLADHSVRFDAEYSIGSGPLSGYDLSLGTFDFEVTMIYTVYAP